MFMIMRKIKQEEGLKVCEGRMHFYIGCPGKASLRSVTWIKTCSRRGTEPHGCLAVAGGHPVSARALRQQET